MKALGLLCSRPFKTQIVSLTKSNLSLLSMMTYILIAECMTRLILNAVALLFLTLNDMLVERSGMLVNNFHK